MEISHYFEWERWITGGQMQSVRNQRKILDERGIEYTTSPDLDCDVLHLNNMGPRSIYYAKRAQMKDIPVVIHTHQTAEDFRGSFAFSDLIARPMKPYLEYAYSLADTLVCPSEYNRETVDGYTSTDKRVISNGFDREKLEGFEELREEYLDRYELEPPVVFNVGHVIERKGLDTFIETAEEMPELDFAWFGFVNPTGGRFGRLLQSRSTLQKIENSPENCTFTGYIEDIRGAFAAGDVFFFPTRNENEGIALLEAMGCGKPPVVRDIETFEWLEHGENCLKAEENFEEQLERMKERKLRERIGGNAEEKSREFSLESVGNELVSLYRQLV
ncbi:MAG: glycosyltransferase family 4 protein [Candidatus Nanohaloarchaea archaeon]